MECSAASKAAALGVAFFFGRPAPARLPPRFDFLISLTIDFGVSKSKR
jgi:hypothetical protein